MPNRQAAWLFDQRIRGRALPGLRRWLARPFPDAVNSRVLILYTANAICRSQVAPFLAYGSEIKQQLGGAVRFVKIEDATSAPLSLFTSATHILVQPWFTLKPADLRSLFAWLRSQAPQAGLSVLDGFAHNDLRMARDLPEDLAFYIKKALFRDPAQYDVCWRGDTNLTQYYSDLFGIEADPVDFRPPAGFAGKLRLGPNFFTAPRLMAGFKADAPPPQAGRQIDMQTRLGAKGSPWYSAMRQASLAAAEGLRGVSLSPAGRVSPQQYLAEMAQSRLCFSPFGYGELCWRDIEAFMTGAVLIKPDMGHLKTLPDLYEADVTYHPVEWDFSDLADVVTKALADEDGRERMAQAAYDRVKHYVDTAQFVQDMSELFQPSIAETTR
ncbi:glycosyltransferase [Octadecabacter sp. CECT 8868]|uniref:glycosyltransferase n=1 Tax=Octadecabacter algicola TaxID=2909342 RepID=UPI001F429029|nr:glycosyltransferase [Octadecabacter algicola]MCF2906662.1 glycosyltransferase [Octadecabacter algicola]